MPIYRVTAPNGKVYRVSGPEDADPEQLKAFVLQSTQPPEETPVDYTTGEMLSKGFERGAKRLGSLLGDVLPAMAGSALGFEDYAKRQLGEAAETEKEIQQRLRPQYPTLEQVKGPGDYIPFALETIAEQVPNIATSVIPGVGAGVAATRAGLTAAGRTAAINAGTYLGSYAQNAPEIFQNVYEETGSLAPGAAALVGAASAALDSILPAKLAGQLSGPAKLSIAEKVLEKSGMDKGLLRSVTAGMASAVPTEGLTEGAQEALSIFAEKFVGDNPMIFESKEWNRLMESSVRGAIAGGAFGGVGGGVEYARESAKERRAAEEQRLAQEEATRREQLAAEVSQAGQDIEAYNALSPQMELPGLETGPYTSLYTPPEKEPEKKGKKGEKPAKEKTPTQLQIFTPEGGLTPESQKVADKNEKIAANLQRQEQQRAEKQAKEDAAKLRKLVTGTQLGFPGFDATTVEAQAAAEQQERQARAESGQGDLFSGFVEPSSSQNEPSVTEPTKVEKPTGITGTVISSTKEGLAALGKLLGIGRTARILREDGPLAGKDLSDPAQAAEVRSILEAYASGNPAVGATAKIEEFLARPEFQTATPATPATSATSATSATPAATARETRKGVWRSKDFDFPVEIVNEAPVEKDGVLYSKVIYQGNETFVPTDQLEVLKNESATVSPDDGRAEPSVSDVDGSPVQPLRSEGTGATNVEGLDTVEGPPADTVGGEGPSDTALETQPEPEVEAEPQPLPPRIQNAKDKTDETADKVLRSIWQEETQGDVPAPTSFKDTVAGVMVALADLARKYRYLAQTLKQQENPKNIASIEATLQDLDALASAYGRDARDVFERLKPMDETRFGDALSQLAQMARRQVLEDADAAMENVPPKQVQAKTPAKEVTEEEMEAAANLINDRLFRDTGTKLFAPKFKGKDLEPSVVEMLKNNDLNGVLRSILANQKSPAVRKIINKLIGLNLKTKIAIRKPQGPMGLIDSTTAAFKRWFGDSKVVDAEGKPLVVYHGTSKDEDFTKFKIPKNGAWFTTDTAAASMYAKDNDSQNLKYNLDTRRYEEVNTASRVMPVYLRINNPATLSESDMQLLSTASNYKRVQGQIFDRLRAQGHDGIDLGGGVWVAIGNAKQIKSATGNIGAFDPNNPDIRYAENKAGSYDPATDTIELDPEVGLNEHTVLHEILHAAISNVLANANVKLTKDFQQFFDLIKPRLGEAYGAQNLQEFAAELLSNPEFQSLLKSIKAPRSDSLFKRIMQSIAEFFGITKANRTAFDKGLKFISDAIDITNNVEPSFAQKMYLGTGDFISVGKIGKSMPAFAGDAIERTKNTLSNLQDQGLKKLAFGLLRLDNLRDMYGKQLPSIQTLMDALELRAGEQERRIKDANSKYKGFVQVQRKYPEQMLRLNDIAVEARLAEVDILKPLSPKAKDAKRIAAYNKLKREFESLPDAVQNVYRTIRNDYDASFMEYRKLLTEAAEKISPSLAAKLADQFQRTAPIAGYIPFLRRGDFWVRYTDPATGEPAASAFETVRERQQFIEANLKPGEYTEHQNFEDLRFSGENLPPSSLIFKLVQGLRSNNATDAQVNMVYQAYLEAFPGESLMKNFIKSKNLRGMEKDIISGYGDLMIKWARKIPNSRYIPQIDRALSGIKLEAQNQQDSTLHAAAQNILEQSAFFHNPSYNKFVHGATALSYFEYIAGNISSAVVNLTALPTLVFPYLAGRYNLGATITAMREASKIAVNQNTWGQMPKYKKLYDTLTDHAQLEHTMAREILEGRRQSTDDFNGLKAKIMDGLSVPFVMAEKYNRAVTAIAAYDLEMAKSGNQEKAIREALNTVKTIHTSGIAATGPRWMQTPIGRMFFTFKSFVWNSAYVVARAWHQAFKGESPEVKEIARRQLLTTYGMAAAFMGIKGLPFYGMASVMARMLNALMGDDEEPFDFDEFLRSNTNELFFKGALNYLTNLEIANRAGIATDLLFRDDPRGIAEHGYFLSALQQAIGPLGTIGVNTERGIKLFNDGHVVRGIESIAPSFVRNASKGVRYLVDGATTLDGTPIVEDVSAYNALMQGIGFSPADLSSQYERIQGAKSFEREVNDRRRRILDRYELAVTTGDTDLMDDVFSEIDKFNESRPSKYISADTLKRSIRARLAAEEDKISGIRFDKSLRPEIMERFFEE